MLTGADPSATAVRLNGVAAPHSHGGPQPELVPPYFLDVGQGQTVHIDLPPWSVTSLVIR